MILNNEEWREKASCKKIGPKIFFADNENSNESKKDVKIAKSICSKCNVRAECLNYALNNKISFEPKDPNDFMFNTKSVDPNQKGKPSKKEYTPIKSYRPSGNLVYDVDLLNKIEGKFG